MKENRERGDGYTYKRGTRWWIRYSSRGEDCRESSGSEAQTDATKLLKKRLKEVHADQIGAAKFITPTKRRRTVHDLLEDLKADYGIRGILSSQNRCSLAKSDRLFGHVRAVDLSPRHIDGYILDCQSRGVPSATINRPLQHLVTAYNFALKRGDLTQAPYIRVLAEKGNARRGFLSAQEMDVVISHLPEYLKDFTAYGFKTGSRSGEIKQLRWEMVHGDDEIHIPGDITKNRKARVIPIDEELAELLARRQVARRVELAGIVTLSPYIFFHIRKGRIVPVGDFKKAWHSACVAAGVGIFVCEKCGAEGTALACSDCKGLTKYRGKIFHDLRRSAARDMLKAGIPRAIAKKLTGHLSDSMLDRYSIVEVDDMREAQRRTAQYRNEQKREQQKVVAMQGNR
jgi:integrase